MDSCEWLIIRDIEISTVFLEVDWCLKGVMFGKRVVYIAVFDYITHYRDELIAAHVPNFGHICVNLLYTHVSLIAVTSK